MAAGMEIFRESGGGSAGGPCITRWGGVLNVVLDIVSVWGPYVLRRQLFGGAMAGCPDDLG